MSILDWAKKINTRVLVGVILFLGLSLGLGLVKISAFSAQKEPVRISYDNVVIAASVAGAVQLDSPESAGEQGAMPAGATLVASKSGTKYHLLDCPGAKTIAEKNKIYFKSIAEAVAAGYTPAANCKALNKPASDR